METMETNAFGKMEVLIDRMKKCHEEDTESGHIHADNILRSAIRVLATASNMEMQAEQLLDEYDTIDKYFA